MHVHVHVFGAHSSYSSLSAGSNAVNIVGSALIVTWIGWTVESGVDALPAVRRRGGVGRIEFALASERRVLVGDGTGEGDKLAVL